MDNKEENKELSEGQTEDVAALREEIQKLQNKLRGAAQTREQVRLQNVFVATLQAKLNAANETISALEAERDAHKGGSSTSPPVPAAADALSLEQTNQELLEMCNGLEAELKSEQEEYDALYRMFTSLEEEYKAEKKRWMEERDAAKTASGSDLQNELSRKNFQLEKEKEVVMQLEEQNQSLRQEIEKIKESQYLREKTITDNCKDLIEQFRSDRQQMQQTIEQLQGTNQQSASFVATPKSPEESTTAEMRTRNVSFSPLRDMERQAYERAIMNLHAELLEERKRYFPFQITSSSGIVSKGCVGECSRTAEEEAEWIAQELLSEQNRSIPEGCVKILDFTSAASRVVSTRKMFSVSTNFVDGYWF